MTKQMFSPRSTTTPVHDTAKETQSARRWVRIWRGRTHAKHFDDYASYLFEQGVRKIRAISGNLGVEMFRSLNADEAIFTVLSYWPDLETIKAFAGADIALARHLHADPEYLLELPKYVEHHEIYAQNFDDEQEQDWSRP
jgi:heme-degrading monooxygenase HmoA